MAVSSSSRIDWQNAVVKEIVPRTPRVTSFILTPSEPFAPKAGQHVDVRLTAPDGYQAQRGYSIASAPESTPDIELAIERLEEGEVSPFFHEVVQPGDEIELRGPLGGHFVWSVEEGGPILLIAGGSGVAPLMAMARHRAARGSTVPMAMLFSCRTWDEVIFRDELLAMHGKRDGFELILTLTRDVEKRDGFRARRIDSAMIMEAIGLLPAPPILTFVCGSNAFVSAGSESAEAAGIAAGSIRTERYGG